MLPFERMCQMICILQFSRVLGYTYYGIRRITINLVLVRDAFLGTTLRARLVSSILDSERVDEEIGK